MATLQDMGTADMGTGGVAILLELLKVVKPNMNFVVPDDWVFLNPVKLTGVDAIIGTALDQNGVTTPVVRNTRIFLMPKAHTGSYGAQVLYYNRMSAVS